MNCIIGHYIQLLDNLNLLADSFILAIQYTCAQKGVFTAIINRE